MKRLHQKTRGERGEVGRNAVREAPAEQTSDATIIERAPAGLARPRSDDLADPRQAGPSWDPAPLPAPGTAPVMRVHEVRREHHYEYEYVYEDEKAPAEAPVEQQFVPPSHQLAAQAPEPRGLPAASAERDTSHWRTDGEPQNVMRAGVLAEPAAPEPPTVIWRPDSQHSQKSQRSQRSQRSVRPDSLSSTMSRLGTASPFRKRLGKYLVPVGLGGVGLVVFGVSVAVFSAMKAPTATHAEARVEAPAAQVQEAVHASPPPATPPPASPPPAAAIAATEGAAAAALPAAGAVPRHMHKAKRKGGANVGQASTQGEKGGSSESSAGAGEGATAPPAAKNSTTETKTPETKPARPVEDQAAQELGSSLQ